MIRKITVLTIVLACLLSLSALAGDFAVYDGEEYIIYPQGTETLLLRYIDSKPYVSARAPYISSVTVYEDALYYLLREKGATYAVKREGDVTERIYRFEGEASNLELYDGNLLALVDGGLCLVYPDKELSVRLSSTGMEEFFIYGDSAYFVSSSDRIEYTVESTLGTTFASKGRLCRIDLTNGEITPMTAYGVDQIMLCGDRIVCRAFDRAFPTTENGEPAVGALRRELDIETGRIVKQYEDYDWGCYVYENNVLLRREGGLYKDDFLFMAIDDSDNVYTCGGELRIVDSATMEIKQ